MRIELYKILIFYFGTVDIIIIQHPKVCNLCKIIAIVDY